MIKVDDRRFNRLVLLGLFAGLLLQIVVFVGAFWFYQRNQASSDRVESTHAVLDAISNLNILTERAAATTSGYLLEPTEAREEAYRNTAGQLIPAFNRLHSLTFSTPQQERHIEDMRTRLEDFVDLLDREMSAARSGDLAGARAIFAEESGASHLFAIRAAAAKVAAYEEQFLSARQEAEKRSASLLRLGLAGAAVLMVLISLLTFALVRRYIHDISRTRERLHVLNTDLEGEVERRTIDLKRANEEIQRFAYIVSHDLRSPLVNVLGFTAELDTANKALVALIERAEKEAPQLITDDVRHASEDLPEAIGFIRSSTQKMDRLINAILQLSREGRRNLSPQKLPMDHVVDEIAATLDKRFEAAGATLTIEKPLPDIVGDRVAIEQIFSNLIENAVKYLDDQRAGQIIVRGNRQGARINYEIEDNGRGIDPKDHQRIFDLFRRSGVQDRSGEGIGLAQVRALVNRLGGTIDVASELGEGATFRLNLPATYEDHGSNQ